MTLERSQSAKSEAHLRPTNPSPRKSTNRRDDFKERSLGNFTYLIVQVIASATLRRHGSPEDGVKSLNVYFYWLVFFLIKSGEFYSRDTRASLLYRDCVRACYREALSVYALTTGVDGEVPRRYLLFRIRLCCSRRRGTGELRVTRRILLIYEILFCPLKRVFRGQRVSLTQLINLIDVRADRTGGHVKGRAPVVAITTRNSRHRAQEEEKKKEK